MLKNYVKIAWRSLWNNRFYSLINISGLSVGLTAGILLLLWVQNELSFDKFNHDYEHIYKLNEYFGAGNQEMTWTVVPGPLAVYARSNPDIISAVRTASEFDQNISNKDRSKVFDGNRIAYVDKGFFSMFDFKLIRGNKAALLPNLNSVVITKTMAEKYFNNTDVIGKTIGFKKELFTITGVLQDFPENSSINYDAVFAMAFYAKQFIQWGGNGAWKTIDVDLGNSSFDFFVKLKPGTDPKKVGQFFSAAFKTARKGDSDADFRLQNLADTHLISAEGNTSSLRMVQIFMLVVILLLTIASINYVNLSTARALIRAKEVSIRKIIGAQNKQLFFQFLTETVLLFFIATVLAVVLIYLFTPLYNQITGKNLTFDLTNLSVWKSAALAIVGTLLASSIYPAILLSSFKPVQALKGRITSGVGIASLRKGLVVFQFTISVILLVCTMVMGRQLSFIKSKDIGYDKSYVFSVPLTDEVAKHIGAIQSELKKEVSISSVASSDAYNFSDIRRMTSDLDFPETENSSNSNFTITQVSADKDLIPTMQIKLLQGGNFAGLPSDSSSFIVNETAVKKMGLEQPIGQPVTFHDHKGTIIGVVKDFNFRSLKEQITPLIFFTFSHNRNILYIRTTGAGAKNAIAAVAAQYKEYAGDSPFSYHFLDQSFDEQYKTDQRADTLFNVFAGIAIFISCLGLFGLATYTARVKFKEIGIRKVLGASVASIVRLISTDFIGLVVIAILVAVPVSWLAMHKWLEGFAYQTSISWWIFVLAGMLALLIALATVSFQAIKAALANPVKSLKSE